MREMSYLERSKAEKEDLIDLPITAGEKQKAVRVEGESRRELWGGKKPAC